MDDTLGYSEYEKRSSVTDWHMGSNTSEVSIDSMTLVQHNLQVIQQREVPSDRPSISSSFNEQLTYYRAFTSSLSKLEIICTQHYDLIRLIWRHLFNNICKSLPCNYVYIFLSIYAPEQHYYLSKMIPLTTGLIFTFITTALFQSHFIAEITVIYSQYVLDGFSDQTPWNRCTYKILNSTEVKCHCFELQEFAKMFREHGRDNITFKQIYYYLNNGECFQLAQLLYLLKRIKVHSDSKIYFNYSNVMFVFVWIIATVQYKQLFGRFIWKTLSYAQLLLNIMYLMIFIDLLLRYISDINMKRIVFDDSNRGTFMGMDLDILTESMTSPPIVHILSSRSKKELKLTQDSVWLTLSNSINYLFRTTVYYMVKMYCETWFHAPVTPTILGSFSLFYFWTIYFHSFVIGDIYVNLFFILNFINEFCVLVITLACLMEAVITEWNVTRSWLIIIFVMVAGIFINFTLSSGERICIFLCGIGVCTVLELIIIFWLYTVGRLSDDITFHFGVPPTRLWVICLQIAPFYYTIKVFLIFKHLLEYLKMRSSIYYELFLKFFAFTTIGFAIGVVYAVYIFMYKRKMRWTQLLKPVPEWGPKDYHIRQLRKQFDSRTYIGSQAPRELSRHLISRAELKSYKLDICYDAFPSKRASVDMRYESEKKTI